MHTLACCAQATTVYELRFGAAALGLDGLSQGLQLGVGVCVNDGDTGDGQVLRLLCHSLICQSLHGRQRACEWCHVIRCSAFTSCPHGPWRYNVVCAVRA